MRGKHEAMELHLVHKNGAGQLAVVGVLMQLGKGAFFSKRHHQL
jgi:carbonic anhydrase